MLRDIDQTIATSTISHGNVYGVRQNSGTTAIVDSVIKDNGTYGAYNVLTSTSTFTATNNYWDAFSGPYHATYNASGTGEQISSYVSFDPWLGNTHYTHGDDSVDEINEEMLWKWATSTESQDYEDELLAAIATWNALDPIDIAETGGAADVEVTERDMFPLTWSAQYSALVTPSTITLNLSQIESPLLVGRVQKTWTHELGHALGLDEGYWENVMYPYRTTQTTLGNQDIEDYHYLWGY